MTNRSRASFTLLALLAATPSAAQNEETITFSEGLHFCTLPAAEQRVVDGFAHEVAETKQRLGTQMLSALSIFSKSMSFPSSAEATPKLARELMQTAFEEGIDALAEEADKTLPGVSVAVALVKAAAAEVERAADAKQSHELGAWIRSVESTITNNVQGERIAGEDSVEVTSSGAIRNEVMNHLCKLEGEALGAQVMELAAATDRIRANGVPIEQRLRLDLYLGWIRGHFEGWRGAENEKTPGSIDIRWEVADNNGVLSFEDDWTCEVAAPFGDKVAEGLNEVMRALATPLHPLDLPVRKKTCFWGELVLGGRGWRCGMLDAGGAEEGAPVSAVLRRAFFDPRWRAGTTHFRSGG